MLASHERMARTAGRPSRSSKLSLVRNTSTNCAFPIGMTGFASTGWVVNFRSRSSVRSTSRPGVRVVSRVIWRRERDSNPRYGSNPYNALAGRPLRPLGHLSGERELYLRTAGFPAVSTLSPALSQGRGRFQVGSFARILAAIYRLYGT